MIVVNFAIATFAIICPTWLPLMAFGRTPRRSS